LYRKQGTLEGAVFGQRLLDVNRLATSVLKAGQVSEQTNYDCRQDSKSEHTASVFGIGAVSGLSAGVFSNGAPIG
jgi:hypothetical protein